MRDVGIRDDMIRLGQFLKLAGMADSGSDAKVLLEAGEVRVNEVVETRRGRQLRTGDRVSVHGDSARVVAPAGSHRDLLPVPEPGGDPACWAHLVCQECGIVPEAGAGHRDGCPNGERPPDRDGAVQGT